jgi:cell division protein FtsL
MSYQRTSQFASRRASALGRNQNTVAFASNVKLGPVTHTVLVALMITVLGLIYLTQATRTTGYDYEAQKIDSKIAELNNQKTDLEVENARLTALENVQNSSVAREMTKPASTDYVRE